MSTTKEQILNALSHVDDPDIKKDIVSLNMVKEVEIDGDNISIDVELTTPICPMKDEIESDIKATIHHMVSDQLNITVNFGASITSSRANSEPLLPGVKNIIVVASGKGGVGKSTVSVNLAAGLAKQGAKVGLIDADIHGPSIPTMLGMKDAKPGVVEENGKHKIVPLEKFGIKILSIGFLADETQAVVWRGPMVSSALKQFIGDAVWGELDYLVLDLPPGTGDVHLTLVQTIPITGAVIVTTPQDVAVADVRKAFGMFNMPNIKVPIVGILENMAFFTPPEMPDQKYFIFGQGGGEKLADEYDVSLLGQIPIGEPVRISGDNGTPLILSENNDIIVEAFDNFVTNTARQISVLNAKKVEELSAVPS